MKLISLNAWGGICFAPLMEFIREHAATTGVFCFQEASRAKGNVREANGARMNLFKDIAELLPDFSGSFAPIQNKTDFRDKPLPSDVETGTAIFIRRTVPVRDAGQRFLLRSYNENVVHGDLIDWPALLHYAVVDVNGAPLTVMSVHGSAQPGSKLDTPERLEQSRNIISFLAEHAGEKVLCGDFNLLPETESIRMIEQSGMRNLVMEFNIPSTRGTLHRKQFEGKADVQEFAGYAFVSPGITVERFTVPDLPVSDHLPMILEF